MAAPSFYVASNGLTDAGGAWDFTTGLWGTAPDVGDLVVVQILQDGATAGAVAATTWANIEALDGTDNSATSLGSFAVGSPTVAYQHIWIGRAIDSGVVTVSGTNSTSEDLYIRMYAFKNVSTGTTLATVIENGTFGLNGPSTTSANVQGETGLLERQATSFVAPGALTVTSVDLWLMKTLAPADNLVVEIQTDSAGSPSGTVVGTGGSIAAGTLTTSLAKYTISLSATLSAGTTYWLVFSRTGARDTTNYFNVGYTPTSVQSGKNRNSGTWSGAITGHAFQLYHTTAGTTDNSVATDATVRDTAVTTLGPDRLALQLIGINDDNAISNFTGETGGDWTEAVAEYAEASGTDASVGLDVAWPGYPIAAIVPLSGSSPIYGTGTFEAASQSFTTGGAVTASAIRLRLGKFGSPTDNVVVQLWSDDGFGFPSSSLTTIGTVACAGLAASSSLGTWVQLDFSYALSASTVYHIVLTRDGSRDTSNYPAWISTNTDLITGTSNRRDSGAWNGSPSALDLAFALRTQSETSGVTIDGGTFTQADGTDGWGVVGFALKGITYGPPPTAISYKAKNIVTLI